MPITVRIPPNMRRLVGGQAEIEVEATTVIEALVQVSLGHVALRERLLDDEGTLAKGLNIFVNKDSIKRLGGVDTAVQDGDRIVVLLAMAGG